MNWVKIGITFNGMNKSFAGATPPAIPKGIAPRPNTTADASGGLAPPAAQAKPTPPPVQTPAAQSKPTPPPTPAPQPTNQGGVSGMLSSFGTPQGFAGLAGMMPGAVQALANVGGMPAIMGTYQFLKGMRGGEGANDWKVLTDPNYKAAFIKRAANPWLGIATGPTAIRNPWLGLATGPTDIRNPWLAPDPLTFTTQGPGTGVPVAAAAASEGHPLQTVGKDVAMDMARREAMYQGLSRSAKFWGPKLGLQEAQHIPGLKGGVLFDTPLNATEDMGDLAGVLPHWAGGKGDTLWFKSQRDPQGKLQYDQNADLVGQYQWNPSAFGNWDVQQFNRDTTPNSKWGFGMMETGKPWLDDPLSYAGSSLNTYSHPLKGLYSVGKFEGHDLNPARDWEALVHPSRLTSTGWQAKSIPGIYAQNEVLQADKPVADYRPGGKYYEDERQHWLGRYHPVYNPDESKGKPWTAYLGL